MGAYGVSKAALFALTKVLAMELGCYGIRVNCIVPGSIKTDFGKVVRFQNVSKNLNKRPNE